MPSPKSESGMMMNPMLESVFYNQIFLNIDLKIQPNINHKKFTQQKSPKKNSPK